MKLKNVKIGVRVQLKKDHPYQSSLKKGMKGIILEDGVDVPYISWDNLTDGCIVYECEHLIKALHSLNLPKDSVRCETIENLKIVK